MKSKVFILLTVFFIAFGFFPLVNFFINKNNAEKEDVSKYEFNTLKENVFNLDNLYSFFSKYLFSIGISIKEKEVLVGKNHWLFLGDNYENTRSIAMGLMSVDKQRLERMLVARKKWDEKIKLMGGIGYYVFIAPNKESIYYDFLPDWAQFAKSNSYQILLDQAQKDSTLINPIPFIKASKDYYPYEIYYKTDTHWNMLGGWLGYQVLGKHIANKDKSLKWLNESDISCCSETKIKNGDLSRLLLIQNYIEDKELNLYIKKEINIEVINYLENDSIYIGKNKTIGYPTSLILVQSPQALNHLKVLWLQDSFGGHMQEYMYATFSSVLQAHWNTMDLESLDKILVEYKPDIFIISVVERSSMHYRFMALPKEG